MPSSLELTALRDFPLVEPGDALHELVAGSLRVNDLELREGDVLIVAQKIVLCAVHAPR